MAVPRLWAPKATANRSVKNIYIATKSKLKQKTAATITMISPPDERGEYLLLHTMYIHLIQ